MPKIQEARLRHALHYGKQLQQAQALFLQGGSATAEGLALFDTEAANIQAAHQWSIDESGTDPAAKVLSTLFPLQADIQMARLAPSRRIETLRHAVRACGDLGDLDQMVLHGSNLAIALVDAGHLATALEMYEGSLAHFRKVGDRKNEGIALGNMADICRSLGNLDRARECVERRLALAREDRDVQAEAAAVNSLGSLRAVVNDRDGAIHHFRQALGVFERTGNRRFELAVLCNLCDALAGSDDAGRAEARVYLERALGLSVRAFHRIGRCWKTPENSVETRRGRDLSAPASRVNSLVGSSESVSISSPCEALLEPRVRTFSRRESDCG